MNSGFPVLGVRDLESLIAGKKFATGDVVRFDVKTGQAENLSRGIRLKIEPMSLVQYEIFKAGGLFKYGRTLI